jgi:hypothetical protein
MCVRQLTDLYRDDARLYVLHVLLDEVEMSERGMRDPLKFQLLAEVLAEFSAQPNFVTLVSTALEVWVLQHMKMYMIPRHLVSLLTYASRLVCHFGNLTDTRCVLRLSAQFHAGLHLSTAATSADHVCPHPVVGCVIAR